MTDDLLPLMLGLVIRHCRLNRVLCQNRAVNFHRWQSQFFGNLRVFNLQSLIYGFAFDPLGHE
jgi:hypothetical protein